MLSVLVSLASLVRTESPSWHRVIILTEAWHLMAGESVSTGI